jgi:hypothetical protein
MAHTKAQRHKEEKGGKLHTVKGRRGLRVERVDYTREGGLFTVLERKLGAESVVGGWHGGC